MYGFGHDCTLLNYYQGGSVMFSGYVDVMEICVLRMFALQNLTQDLTFRCRSLTDLTPVFAQ